MPPETRFRVITYHRDFLIVESKFNSTWIRALVWRSSVKSYQALIHNNRDCIKISANSSETIVLKICEVLKNGI